MRKLMAIVSAVALTAAMTSVSFAASKKNAAVNMLRGEITAVNVAANQVTIKEDGTSKMDTVTVPAAEIADLKQGEHVKVMLKAGSQDQAEKVKVLMHGKKK